MITKKDGKPLNQYEEITLMIIYTALEAIDRGESYEEVLKEVETFNEMAFQKGEFYVESGALKDCINKVFQMDHKQERLKKLRKHFWQHFKND